MMACILFILASLTIVCSEEQTHLNLSANPNVLKIENDLHTFSELVTKMLNKLCLMLQLHPNKPVMKTISTLPVIYSRIKNKVNTLKRYNSTTYNGTANITTINKAVSAIIEDVFQNNYDILYYKTFPGIVEVSRRIYNSTSKSRLDILRTLLKKVNLQKLRRQLKEKFEKQPGHLTVKSVDLKPWRADNSSKTFSNNTRRIFGSTVTKNVRFPFVASLHYLGQFLCAGSIISKDAILSAASCLQIANNDKDYKENPESLTARMGSDFAHKGGQLISIKKIFLHPDYNPTYLKHNLAIAQMRRTIIFTKNNKKIRRIIYDKVGDDIFQNGGSVTILGWGDKDKLITDIYKRPLSLSNIELFDRTACEQVYSGDFVYEANFCVGYSDRGSGACNGDVGDPGINGDSLIGVVSFGPQICGAPEAPTVFTKVSVYAEWIDSILNQTQTLPEPTILENPQILLRENKKKLVTPGHKHTKDVGYMKKLFKEMILAGELNLDDILNSDSLNISSHKSPEIAREGEKKEKKEDGDIHAKILNDINGIKKMLGPIIEKNGNHSSAMNKKNIEPVLSSIDKNTEGNSAPHEGSDETKDNDKLNSKELRTKKHTSRTKKHASKTTEHTKKATEHTRKTTVHTKITTVDTSDSTDFPSKSAEHTSTEFTSTTKSHLRQKTRKTSKKPSKKESKKSKKASKSRSKKKKSHHNKKETDEDFSEKKSDEIKAKETDDNVATEHYSYENYNG